MIAQSLAAIAVIVVMSGMYLRSGKFQLAGMGLPLLCLPAAHLLGAVLWGTPQAGEGVDQVFAYRCIALAIGLLAGLTGCVVLSRGLTPRAGRVAYVVLCAVFSVGLAVAYLLFLL